MIILVLHVLIALKLKIRVVTQVRGYREKVNRLIFFVLMIVLGFRMPISR